MTTKAGSLLLFALFALPLAGCGDGGGDPGSTSEEKRIEDYAKSFGVDADVKLDEKGEVSSVAVNRNYGGVATQGGSNLSVPDDFPDDIALYPDMNIFSAGDMAGRAQMLQGQAGAEASQVEAFYKEEMAAKGWTEASPAMQSPAMRVMKFTKGAREASVNLIPGNPGTTVQIMATPGG